MILLLDINSALYVEFCPIIINDTCIKRSKKNNFLHNGIRRTSTLSIRIDRITGKDLRQAYTETHTGKTELEQTP